MSVAWRPNMYITVHAYEVGQMCICVKKKATYFDVLYAQWQ